MFENVFFLEKWSFSDLKKFMRDDQELYEKHITPGRYPVQKICPSKKTASKL